MKKVLVIGVFVIMLSVSLMSFVLADDKSVMEDEFQILQSDHTYVGVSSPEIEVREDLYNNSAYIHVHNNATYDMLELQVTADDYMGEYPGGVIVDIGDNGRYEYRFDGWSVGQWGHQDNIVSEYGTSLKSQQIFPEEDGQYVYVKMPRTAVVTSAEINISHPLEPVYKEVMFTEENTNEVAVSRVYSYNYDYYTSSDSWYGYAYYYPKDYYDYTSSSLLSYSYYAPPYPYSSTSYLRYYGYHIADVYYDWDIDHPDFSIPTGATILEYNLNQPLRRYHYYTSPSYGYDWNPSNPTNYYSGEMDWGIFAVTGDHPTSFTYNYNDYSYNYQYLNPFESNIDDYLEDYLPTNRTTPVDSYHMDEHFHSTSYEDLYDVSFDLKDLYQEWIDGDLENNGIKLSRYQTPYSDQPHYEQTYSYYNTAGSSSQARSKNNYQFYYGSYIYNPLYSSTSYRQYWPRVVIGYDLASTNPMLDVGDDGTVEYTHIGDLEGEMKLSGPTYVNAINTYLNTHPADEVDTYGNEWVYVPFKFDADSAGKITVDDLKIIYDYTATVYYNPWSNALGEVNSLVPMTEEGETYIRVNVTAKSMGNIKLHDFELTGNKPNYRPVVMEMPDIEVEEGIVDEMLLELTQYFDDPDQDPATLDYRIQQNSQSGHLDLWINKVEGTRDTHVYLGIDTTKDVNWFGDVDVQISATDEYGKDVWGNEFTISLAPVNDYPEMPMEMELPELMAYEGRDDILIEYNAPSGRDVAVGKMSFLMSGDGSPYFEDIEGQRIYLNFELLDENMEPATLEKSEDDGFRVYRGMNSEISLFVLPPEYTEDPDNFIVVLGSHPDFNTHVRQYYLKVYASDDFNDLFGQSSYIRSIEIMPYNDAPRILPITDVFLDEDTSYTSDFDFIEEYITDIDSDMEDVTVRFISSDDGVHVELMDEGFLHVELDPDFNGVVPVTVEASDTQGISEGSFKVKVSSVNDLPVVVVDNLYDGRIIDGMFHIRGSANDIEKTLRWIEVGIVREGETLYVDDWQIAEGAYVWQSLVDIRNFDSGVHEVHIRAYDGEDYSEEIVYTIELSKWGETSLSPPPEVTITTELMGDQMDSIMVEGTVEDDSGYVEFVEFRIDGGIWKKAGLETGGWQAKINTRLLTNDNHNLSVRAYDGKLYSEIVFMKFDVYNLDSDLDGIPNDVEESLLMDPFNALDGAMDFDEDGYSNSEELSAQTDPFDGGDHPEEDSGDPILEGWVIVFLAVAFISTIIILGLFLLNIRLERNMHAWREDLNKRRLERRPKTLLQKIVEIAPSRIGTVDVPSGPALPGTDAQTQEYAALPSGPEEQPPQQ